MFFSSLAEASAHTGAEIYKYIGDEAILTWPSGEATSRDQALQCFFRFQKNLDKVRLEFESRFAMVPEFRGAIHRGVVVAGELGEARKEIAYLGDVVNTTARLMETARSHKVKLVVSEEFLKLYKVQRPQAYKFDALGEESLRGKDEKVAVYSVTAET